MENERLVKTCKKNMKLYPIYRMFAYDIVFLYAIKFIFLTQIKGISASDIIFSVSIYAMFMIILQIPATIVIEKIGYRKSAFLSNLFNAFYVGILMFSTNLIHLIIAEFISALTFSLKEVAEPSLLNSSIPKTQKKGKIYSKIEGKGTSHYYYLDAITAVLSGFIYAINPYLPLILSMIVSVIACLLSLLFDEIKIEQVKKEDTTKQYLIDTTNSFKIIFKSKRLRSLILYSGIMWGTICLINEYRNSIITYIGTPSQIIGIIAAAFGIISGIASKKQVQFHNKFRNNSLSVIAFTCSIAAIIAGGIVMINSPFVISLLVIVLAGFVVKIDSAMNNILVNRYLGNFTNKEILPKIYAANSIARNLMRMIIGMVGSFLIGRITSAYAMFIVGCVSLFVITILMSYMKTRVGLKPEEYKKEEIELEVS